MFSMFVATRRLCLDMCDGVLGPFGSACARACVFPHVAGGLECQSGCAFEAIAQQISVFSYHSNRVSAPFEKHIVHISSLPPVAPDDNLRPWWLPPRSFPELVAERESKWDRVCVRERDRQGTAEGGVVHSEPSPTSSECDCSWVIDIWLWLSLLLTLVKVNLSTFHSLFLHSHYIPPQILTDWCGLSSWKYELRMKQASAHAH